MIHDININYIYIVKHSGINKEKIELKKETYMMCLFFIWFFNYIWNIMKWNDFIIFHNLPTRKLIITIIILIAINYNQWILTQLCYASVN